MSGANVAVPPPLGAGQERARSNSNMTGRLRAASEMQREGYISKEEKGTLKHLLLHSDPAFREEFDRARRTKDLSTIKRLLQEHPQVNDSVVNDLTGMTLGEVDDISSFLDGFVVADSAVPDFFGAEHAIPATAVLANGGLGATPAQMRHRQSVGFGDFAPPAAPDGDAGPTRKRQASRSMPSQGMNKVVANSAPAAAPDAFSAAAAGAPPVGARRASGPLDVHRAAAAAAAVPPLHPSGSRTRQGVRGVKAEPGRGAAHAYKPAAARPAPRQLQPELQQEDEDEDSERMGEAKSRKNERERKRRLAVTQGFDELYKLLRALEDQRNALGPGPLDAAEQKKLSAMATSKLDKASILRNTIDRIQALQAQVVALRKDNDRIQLLLQQQAAGKGGK